MYKNTHLAAHFLGLNSPFSLHSFILHCDDLVWPLFSHLENAVREGSNQHEQVFGKKAQDLFQVFIFASVISKNCHKDFVFFIHSQCHFCAFLCRIHTTVAKRSN